jgi:hypothetical protein
LFCVNALRISWSRALMSSAKLPPIDGA